VASTHTGVRLDFRWVGDTAELAEPSNVSNNLQGNRAGSMAEPNLRQFRSVPHWFCPVVPIQPIDLIK